MNKPAWSIIIVLFSTLNFYTAKSQENGDFANMNCVKEGTILVDAFYGWPNFNALLLRSVIGNTNLKFRNTNHIGLKAEYMISDNISLGGEFSYADAAIQYQTSTSGRFAEAGITKYRIVGRFNYHFKTTKDLDPYFSVGTGYKKTVYYDTGNSNYRESFNLFPVSFKLAIGLRYFFNDLVGMHTEIGIGGPLIHAGLCVKL